MKYTILLYETEADFNARRAEPRDEKYWGAYRQVRSKFARTCRIRNLE